jgi:acyl-CoA thioesterase FadM
MQPFTPKLRIPDGVSAITFHVMPHDLDAIGHMNNGRYFTIADLGRFDLVLSSGLWRAVVKHRWMPVVSAIAMRFRREMRLFTRYRLETRLVGWDESVVVIEHQFVIESGQRAGQVAARALAKAGFYDRSKGQYVSIREVMEAMGYTGPTPKLSPDVEAFLRADDAMRQVA